MNNMDGGKIPQANQMALFYEQLKQAWIFAHPDATPAEYEQAIREIAREIGY